jgi:hypothetical protein
MDQMPKAHAGKECFFAHSMPAQILSTVLTSSVKVLKNDKAKLKLPYENTYKYTPFTYYMNFLCVKVIYNFVFKMLFSILHCKNCYIYIFMTSHPNIYIYIYIYIYIRHTFGSKKCM